MNGEDEGFKGPHKLYREEKRCEQKGTVTVFFVWIYTYILKNYPSYTNITCT